MTVIIGMMFLVALVVVILLSFMGIYFLLTSCFFKYPPAIPVTGKMKKKLFALLDKELSQTTHKTMMDLGCGFATALVPLAKKYPQHTFIGVERDLSAYLIAKLRSCRLKNVRIIKANLFDYDISQADIVYLFLMDALMPAVTKKCEKELKSGSVVYSGRFKLTRPADETVNLGSAYYTMYVYRF